jgi:hypothetical protein
MRRSLSLVASCLGAALIVALGCSGSPAQGTTGATSSTSQSGGAAGAGGSAGAAGAGGEEPLPPLDPAACPVTADSGEDPAIAAAAEMQWSAAYTPPTSGSIEQDKAFFLATLLGADAALLGDLAADMTLAAAAKDRDDRLRGAPAKCAEDVACYADALKWPADGASGVADALAARLASSGKLMAFAKDMRSSGRFSLHATLDDGGLVKAAFLDFTTALDDTFDGEASSLGGPALRDVVTAVAAAHPAPFAFFDALLQVDLAALTADKRDEATRYEPLAQGENAAAAAHIPAIDWSKYPFTVILVPGLGPTSLDVALSPGGQARADLAAQRWKAGVAPLIVLSGGHVHPDRTPYSEAIEMKKYLRAAHGIPEEALLVDPHARHTTTNLRNASRLLYRHGIPTDRALLVTTDLGQSIYIGYWHGTFGPRCMDELGYLPWRSLVPISKYDTCMVPVAVSLHADGRDPLDP